MGWSRVLHPDDASRVAARWAEAVRTGALFESRYRLRAADGSYRWFIARALPMRDNEGKAVRWAGSLTDIDDLVKAQEALASAKASAEAAKLIAERAAQEAEQASHAKDQFLAVLSHELRTPLAPVLATVSMLEQRPEVDGSIHEALEMVRRNVELEARLIDDLLDITRIARGKIELNRRVADLCEILRYAEEVCRPDLDAANMHFRMDIEPTGECPVLADVSRLEQVFWNLIKNAVKFTPRGGCIGVRCHREGPFAIVDVADSGVGIEPEAMGRIFNAFEQAERSITRQFGGLGLGLAISKALVEIHGGTIEARSEGKGKGAVFTVKLPLLPLPTTAEAPSSPSAGRHEPTPAGVRPLRILLVEDHEDTAQVMQQLLELDGHTVQMASDVTTALDLSAHQDFDLIISDLGLPDGTGLDLLRKLRAQGKTMPGIALSGYGQEQDIRESREAGFATHLIKPVSADRLEQAIAAQASGKN